MIIKFEVELTEAEALQLTTNSIERVMNNAIHVGAVFERGGRSREGDRERASTLWQDCEELLPVMRKLWWDAANAVRVAAMKKEQKS
jgi:hypothetical protein